MAPRAARVQPVTRRSRCCHHRCYDHAARFGGSAVRWGGYRGYRPLAARFSCDPARDVIHYGRQDRRLRRGGIDRRGETVLFGLLFPAASVVRR